MVLPSTVVTGKATGRFLDMTRKGSPMQIRFEFMPVIPYLQVPTATPPVSLIATPTYAETDDDGDVCQVLDDNPGKPGPDKWVTLVSPETPSPVTGWTWKVTQTAQGRAGYLSKKEIYYIFVPGNEVTDLTTAMKVPGSLPLSESQAVALVAQAREAAAAAALIAKGVHDAAAAGDFDGAPGKDGDPGKDGSNVLPTGAAIVAAIQPGGAAHEVLSGTIQDEVSETIDKTSASNGQVATWDSAAGKFKPKPPAPTGAPRGDMFMGAAVALKVPMTSFGIQATGDSTTTPDYAWFRQLANQVATEYPALTHHYRKWNDVTQDFDRPIAMNAGTTRRAYVMATGGTRVGVRYAGATNSTGDIDIRVNLKSPNWVAGATQSLMSKWTNDASMSWVFNLGGNGYLSLQWSEDGSTVGNKVVSSGTAVPFAANAEGWVRATLDVDNGAGQYEGKLYTSTDGSTWTQLGATVTGTTGITKIFASTSDYTLGARGASSAALLADTRIYEVQVRDGINGPSVLPYLPDMWDLGIGNGVGAYEGAPVLTWVMAGHPGASIGYDGQTIGYLSDPNRMRKMSPHFNQLAHFFNSSHNEYLAQGNLWASLYSNWVDKISANTPLAARIALTQSPRPTSATGQGPKTRRAHMLAWAQRKAGVDVIDTLQAFIADGRPLEPDLISDGTHPTTAGYTIWKNTIKAELDAALARVTSY